MGLERNRIVSSVKHSDRVQTGWNGWMRHESDCAAQSPALDAGMDEDMARIVKARGSQQQRRERGANLVEMALVLPLLLLLLVAVIDFGRAFYSVITIANASREGARYASRYSWDTTGILDAATDYATDAGLDNTMLNATVQGALGASGEGQPITVTVEYTFTTFAGGFVGYPELHMRRATGMVNFGQD